MTLNFKEAVKKPWVKYSLIGIGVVGAFFIVKGRMGTQTAVDPATGLSSAALQAQAQLQAQQNNLAYQASQAANAQSAAAQSQALAATTTTAQQAAQIKGTLDLASIQSASQIALTTLNNAEQTALANVSLQGLTNQLKANTDQQKNTLDSTVALSNISAGLQSHISDNQTAVVNTQTGAAVSIANINAGVANNASNNSGGLFGGGGFLGLGF